MTNKKKRENRAKKQAKRFTTTKGVNSLYSMDKVRFELNSKTGMSLCLTIIVSSAIKFTF